MMTLFEAERYDFFDGDALAAFNFSGVLDILLNHGFVNREDWIFTSTFAYAHNTSEAAIYITLSNFFKQFELFIVDEPWICKTYKRIFHIPRKLYHVNENIIVGGADVICRGMVKQRHISKAHRLDIEAHLTSTGEIVCDLASYIDKCQKLKMKFLRDIKLEQIKAEGEECPWIEKLSI